MVIAHGPARRDVKDANTFLVDVMNSTGIPHGSEDPRRAHSATELGRGTIGIVIDADGRPVGYRWSAGPRKDTPIAVGRLR